MNKANRVAVVTGGASGIGLALARAAAPRADTVVVADLDAGALDLAEAQLRGEGIDIRTFVVDLRDRAKVVELADLVQSLGRTTLACFNAGVAVPPSNTWETPPEVFDFVLAVNLIGLANSIRAIVPAMVAEPARSDVIVTASMAGMVASAYSGAYSASKAGAIALTKALRDELAAAAPHVHVALLNPGMVRTNLMKTSVAQRPGAEGSDLLEFGHGLLTEMGAEPDEAARWAFDALDRERFWALPPHGDPFVQSLVAELDALGDAAGR